MLAPQKWRWSYPNIDDELACLYTEARGIPTDDDGKVVIKVVKCIWWCISIVIVSEIKNIEGGWMDGVCWKVEDRKDWDCICKRAN